MNEQPRKKVMVTRKIPDAGLVKLQSDFDVVISPQNRALTKEELVTFVKGADALITLLTDKIDANILNNAGPQLKIIANYAVGYDNIDLKAANKKSVLVTNTPDVLTQAVAEHTIGLIFALARHIPQADAFTRSGKYVGWDPFLYLGMELKDKIFGVIGLGRIGTAVATAMAKGFGMKIVYSTLYRNEDIERDFGATFAPLDDLLRTADVISIHSPLTPETYHLINSDKLALMKPTALLINTARGQIIDEAALVQALREKKIAGAALDVFESEPKLALGLAELDNIVITPHIASATLEARQAMSLLVAENVKAALSGKTPPNLVVTR